MFIKFLIPSCKERCGAKGYFLRKVLSKQNTNLLCEYFEAALG